MNYSRYVVSPRHLAFAAALAVGLSAASALAQTEYYPSGNPENPGDLNPLDNNAALKFVSDQLVTGNLGTPTAVTDAELDAALGAAVGLELGNPGAFSGTVFDLVNETVKFRKNKAGKLIVTATTNVLGVTDDTQRQTNLESVVSGAVQGLGPADLKYAPKVVGSMLKQVAAAGLDAGVSDDADDIVELAVEAAEHFADKIVKDAMKAVKKVDSAQYPTVIDGIAFEGVSTAFSEGAGYLADEVAAAAVANGGLRTPAQIAAAILATGSAVPTTQEDVGLIAGGLMRGAGSASVGPIVTAINGLGNGYGGFDGFVSAVGAGFTTAAGNSDPALSAALTVAGAAANPNDIAARVIGAGAFLQRSVPLFIQGVLTADRVGAGDDTVAQIVQAAVQVNQKGVGKIAEAAVQGGAGAGEEANRLGQVAQGTALGLDGNPLYNSLLRTALTKAVKGVKTAGGLNAASAGELTAFAITGAQASGNPTAVADIAFGAAKASKLSNDVVSGGFGTVAAADQWRVVLGAMAADKKGASAIRTAAQALGTYNASNNAALATAGQVVLDTHLDKKAVFTNALTGFGASASSTETLAVVTGAGLIVPKAASALAAAAIADPNSASVDAIRAAAIGVAPKAAAGTTLAVDTAVHVNAGQTDLFEFVSHLSQQNQKFAADIATGATVVAPQYTHVTAHAVAFGAPLKAAKAVSALFSYSRYLDNTLVADPVSAAAAITAGLTCGIVESQVDPLDLTRKKEGAALKAAIGAAIKAVAGVEGGFIDQATGVGLGMTNVASVGAAGVVTGFISQRVNATTSTLPGGATGIIGVVITTAVKKAKTHTLAIAQAAAQAIASISSSFTADAGGQLAAAIDAAATGVSIAAIQNAITVGINQAGSNVLGAGAAGVMNYAHFNCTGDAVTSIFDL